MPCAAPASPVAPAPRRRASLTVAAATLVALLGACERTTAPDLGEPPAAPAAAGAPASSYAVTVDFSQPTAGVRSMAGFIHGMSKLGPPLSLVTPLGPAFWRIGTFDSTSTHIPTHGIYQRLRDQLPGAGVQIVLSDMWGYPNYFTRKWPYEDWAAWERFVDSVAVEHQGRNVTWDVWNEPDIQQFWPQSAASDSLFRETYARAYKILRRHMPDAKIGGPSYSQYFRDRIVGFLDYCAVAPAGTTGPRCQVNVLSWHELGPDIPGIETRLKDARANLVMGAKYAGLGIGEIHVNESVSQVNRNYPGASVNTLYYLERGGADRAAKTCWGDSNGQFTCDNNSVDGLLTSDQKPRANWWAYKAYADGVASRVASGTGHPNLVALGSRQIGASADTAQVLLGFSSPDGRPRSAGASVRLAGLNTLPFLTGRTTVRVQVWRIPNWLESHVPQLELRSDQSLPIQSGVATLSPTVDMHHAYVVKLLKQ